MYLIVKMCHVIDGKLHNAELLTVADQSLKACTNSVYVSVCMEDVWM